VNQVQSATNEVRPWLHGVIFLAACAVILTRRPDALFHAQPYAEDGHVWFADAYNLGWAHALLRTWTGYFLTLPRLAASLALLAPFSRFPLVLNLIAVPLQALPANLLVAKRSQVWGSLPLRGSFAAIYLILPNCSEVSNGITDANFLIVLSFFLILVASVPQSSVVKALDFCLMGVSGLSGPFCIFLLPIAVYLTWKERKAWRWVQVGICLFCCLIQMGALVFLAPGGRAHRELGASLALGVKIVGGQVFLGALLGSNGLAMKSAMGLSIFLIAVALAGLAFIGWCFLRTPQAMRIFILFSGVVFLSGLMKPLEWGQPTMPVWLVFAGTPGLRYWFFPTLAFAWCLLWCLQEQKHSPSFRAAAAVLLCVMLIGIVRDWRHPAFPDEHFADSAKRFDAAPAGEVVVIPESPAGWDMRLVKHSR
jgi:hypothetical protein